jgi:RecA-family ATPase
MSDLWKNLNLPAELREFMTLSPGDINALTIAAMQAADPKESLEKALIERAEKKKALKADY